MQNTPLQALSKLFFRITPTQEQINLFKNNLKQLHNYLEQNPNDTEDTLKDKVADFLKETYYKEKFQIKVRVNNIDLAIYNGKNTESNIGIMIELKRLSNRTEMITPNNLNQKALQELLLYYLQERVLHNNIELKHLIITDAYNWFIFDAQNIEQLFFENKELLTQFNQYKNGILVQETTAFFYNHIAQPAIEKMKDKIEFTHFNIITCIQTQTDNELIPYYNILSPEYLLKLPVANDSNTLNKAFYNELLYLMGLQEITKDGKPIVCQLTHNKQSASLLEQIFTQLNNSQIQASFETALELCITWINRILFLKLLEAQMVSYHDKEKKNDFKFLHTNKIKNFNQLNSFFFNVLAKTNNQRTTQDQNIFGNVPYLNSSLFEQSKIEQNNIFINSLDNDIDLDIFNNTALKNQQGEKRTGKQKILDYLFEFLDAYDFGSDPEQQIQTTEKPLINAAVLGLIFEKINGYKDGAIFTPSTITMYMCREALQQTIIQKFNEANHWQCQSLIDVHNKIQHINEANDIFKSIKICDPAVGSGHFLVSTLNEMIFIKQELGILCDSEGKTIKGYNLKVQNDELIITDDQGKYFRYNPLLNESQRLQQTLFYEKQSLIENCLFGVDINPKSVLICRLRLWIELLKNAYYKQNGEMETLPNIDINIKCGDSLVSLFNIEDNYQQFHSLQKQNINLATQQYKEKVALYKAVNDKAAKDVIRQQIENIKIQFRENMIIQDKDVIKLKSNQAALLRISSELPGMQDKQDWEKQIEYLTQEIHTLETIIEERYKHALEWRFEFPEVLNDEGDFVGFDLIIGNPPYIQLQSEAGKLANHLQGFNYKTFERTGDIYTLFYEKGISLVKQNGWVCLITSNKWMRAKYGEGLRQFLATQNPTILIDLGAGVFDSATVDTNILLLQKNTNQKNTRSLTYKNQNTIADEMKHAFTLSFTDSNTWSILSPIEKAIKQKIEAKGTPLKDWDIQINYGIKTGYNEAFIIDTETKNRLCTEDPNSAEIITPILRGRDIKRYQANWAGLWLINTHNGLKANKEKGIKKIKSY